MTESTDALMESGERLDLLDNIVGVLGFVKDARESLIKAAVMEAVRDAHSMLVLSEVSGPAFLTASDAAKITRLEQLVSDVGSTQSRDVIQAVFKFDFAEHVAKWGVLVDPATISKMVAHADAILESRGFKVLTDAVSVVSVALSITKCAADDSAENRYALFIDVLGLVPTPPVLKIFLAGHAVGDICVAAYNASTGRDFHNDLAETWYLQTEAHTAPPRTVPLFNVHGAYSFMAEQYRSTFAQLGLPLPDEPPAGLSALIPDEARAGKPFDVAADGEARQFDAVPVDAPAPLVVDDADDREGEPFDVAADAGARQFDAVPDDSPTPLVVQDDDGGAVHQLTPPAEAAPLLPDADAAGAGATAPADDGAGVKSQEEDAAREEASILVVQSQVNVADDGVFSIQSAPTIPAPMMPDAHESTYGENAASAGDLAAAAESPMMPDAEVEQHAQQAAAAAHAADVVRHDQQQVDADNSGQAAQVILHAEAQRAEAARHAAIAAHNAQGAQVNR